MKRVGTRGTSASVPGSLGARSLAIFALHLPFPAKPSKGEKSFHSGGRGQAQAQHDSPQLHPGQDCTLETSVPQLPVPWGRKS